MNEPDSNINEAVTRDHRNGFRHGQQENPTKPEAEIAADLLKRGREALKPLCALMDEAAAHGLIIGWEAITAGPPFLRHEPRGLKVIKQYVARE